MQSLILWLCQKALLFVVIVLYVVTITAFLSLLTLVIFCITVSMLIVLLVGRLKKVYNLILYSIRKV